MHTALPVCETSTTFHYFTKVSIFTPKNTSKNEPKVHPFQIFKRKGLKNYDMRKLGLANISHKFGIFPELATIAGAKIMR